MAYVRGQIVKKIKCMSKNWTGNKVLVKYVEKQSENLKWWQLKEAQHSMCGKSF